MKAQVVGIAAVERNAPAQSADASGDTVMRVQPRAKVVYKITYPNGMIYIGLDLTNTLTYMGSPSVADQIAADLGPERCQDFTIRKTILWSSTTAADVSSTNNSPIPCRPYHWRPAATSRKCAGAKSE